MNGSGVSADMAVDPGGELVDPGVDPRQVGSAAARPPADDAHQEPATSSRGPAGQRTSRVALGQAGQCGHSDRCCHPPLALYVPKYEQI